MLTPKIIDKKIRFKNRGGRKSHHRNSLAKVPIVHIFMTLLNTIC